MSSYSDFFYRQWLSAVEGCVHKSSQQRDCSGFAPDSLLTLNEHSITLLHVKKSVLRVTKSVAKIQTFFGTMRNIMNRTSYLTFLSKPRALSGLLQGGHPWHKRAAMRQTNILISCFFIFSYIYVCISFSSAKSIAGGEQMSHRVRNGSAASSSRY